MKGRRADESTSPARRQCPAVFVRRVLMANRSCEIEMMSFNYPAKGLGVL